MSRFDVSRVKEYKKLYPGAGAKEIAGAYNYPVEKVAEAIKALKKDT